MNVGQNNENVQRAQRDVNQANKYKIDIAQLSESDQLSKQKKSIEQKTSKSHA